MLHRAYSVLAIKDIHDEHRLIEGIASTPETDRMGDIVDPKGASFRLPIPLLWQHRADQPIGHVMDAKVTADGIRITAQIAKDIGVPRIDEAWALIKSGLVRGLSIGFQALEMEAIKSHFGGTRFLKWEWLELSAVTIPANGDASILSIKSADVGKPAVSGAGRPVFITPRVAGGLHTDTAMKPIQDQIKDFENTRAAKVAEMDALQTKVATEGRTKDVSEKETFDGLSEQIQQIDAEMADLRKMESINKAAAVAVVGGTKDEASASRALHTVTIKPVDQRPGIGFAKMAMCVAASRGNMMQAYEMSKMHYPDELQIQQYLKAAVGAATTANTFGPLLQYTDFLGDFVNYLRPMTIVGKFGTNGIPDVTHVPFNVRVSTQTSGGSAYWVGQGKPKPLTAGVYGTITLDFHKVATIAVLTKEEVRFASPSAEAKVRDDIAAAVADRIDRDFIDPANAGTAGVKPASITNGIASSAVSGTDADAVRVDLKTLINGMLVAGIQPTSLVLIMSQQIALSLMLMRNALGSDEFPNMTMNGGSLNGIPVIASEYVTSLGSPAGSMIVAVNAKDIYLADDGGVSVEASDQASLEMLDASLVQDGTIGTGTSLVSLWQTNMLGLRAEREITWKKRRAAAVAYASPVAYTPST